MPNLNDRKQICFQMERFLKAWETGETELLDQCVMAEPYVYFSTHGNCYVREQLTEQLRNAGKPAAFTRFVLANEYSRVQDDRAVQYATILGYFGDGDSHLAFGGTFCNELTLTDSGWMFTRMRFELQTDDAVTEYTLDGEGKTHRISGVGDLSFIQNWQKVNTSIGLFVDQTEGEGKHTLMGECDAPWYLLPENDDRSDEEQVQNTFLRYCCAMDLNTPDLLDGVFAPEAVFHSNQAGELSGRDAVNYLTIVRQASARSFHAVRFEETAVEGEKAHVKAARLRPEAAKRIGDQISYDNGTYELDYVKNGDIWWIVRFQYHIA